MGSTRNHETRRDGWTAARQLRFLDAFVQTRSVAKAAAFAGMSREGAYRFRKRREGALFALLWDRTLQPASGSFEGHIESLSDGRLTRLLGNHYRRESGDFSADQIAETETARGNRT